MKIKQRSEWIHTYLLRVSFGHICLVRKTTKNTHTVSRIIFIKIVDAGSAYPLLIENRRKIGVVYDLHQLELWSVTTASHIEILHDTFIYVYITFLAFFSTKDCDYIMRQLCLCRWYTAAYAPSVELGVIDRAIINQTVSEFAQDRRRLGTKFKATYGWHCDLASGRISAVGQYVSRRFLP